MTTRRHFLVGGIAVVVAPSLPSTSRGASTEVVTEKPAYILGATAITAVFGDGQRLVAVAIEQDRPVDASALDARLYSVDGRSVTRVYSNDRPALAESAAEGAFIIVELSPDDEAARLFVTDGRATERRPAAATLTIAPAATSNTTSGENPSGPPDFNNLPRSVPTDRASNLVIEDFRQEIFNDPATGDTLAYNLYLPKRQDSARQVPLVLFMHDAGNTSPLVDTTLVQGLGAVSWASAGDQERHPAIVLAPQYASQTVNDSSEASSLLDTTLHLLERIADEHGVDRHRIYATGQSGGGMMSIAMMIREPDLFAAAFLVACQWDSALVGPLARQKLWVMVSEGDAKAFPGQNAIMEIIEAAGTPVSRASWDGTSTAEQFASLVAAQAEAGTPVNYTVLRKGTVVPAGQTDDPGSNHINTWRIAYDIPGIRDWIMKQARD